MNGDSTRLIDVKEVARLLQVAVRTVWRLRSSHKIPEPVPVGGSVRWRYQELVDWINRGCPLPGKSPGSNGQHS